MRGRTIDPASRYAVHSGGYIMSNRLINFRKSAPAVWAVLCSATLWPTFASAPVSEPVLRIEEDWELVVNEPNDDTTAPQFHTIMSPSENLDSFHAQTLWNYRETPNFVAGGVQLHSYNGETLIRKRSIESGTLSALAETITWTQALSTDGTILLFEIFNGVSTTWGAFGNDMNISSSAGLSQLNDYDPEVTVKNSCVTFGANRVESMRVVQVRYYGSSGLLAVDNTVRSVCE